LARLLHAIPSQTAFKKPESLEEVVSALVNAVRKANIPDEDEGDFTDALEEQDDDR
jgi:hypothetical protein